MHASSYSLKKNQSASQLYDLPFSFFTLNSLQVPQSYIDLQQAVIQEAERRRTTGEPPVLLEDEILQFAKCSPQNDILDTEELTLGKCASVIENDAKWHLLKWWLICENKGAFFLFVQTPGLLSWVDMCLFVFSAWLLWQSVAVSKCYCDDDRKPLATFLRPLMFHASVFK